jgi:hypothetical protein
MNARPLLRITLILVLFVITNSLRAQNFGDLDTWSVEEFAQKLTDQMTPRVPLDSAQVIMVHRINQKFAEQTLPVVKGTETTNRKVEIVRGFDDERRDELKVFLGAEQMRQVKQIQSENRRKLKQEFYEKNL